MRVVNAVLYWLGMTLIEVGARIRDDIVDRIETAEAERDAAWAERDALLAERDDDA